MKAYGFCKFDGWFNVHGKSFSRGPNGRTLVIKNMHRTAKKKARKLALADLQEQNEHHCK